MFESTPLRLWLKKPTMSHYFFAPHAPWEQITCMYFLGVVAL